MAIIQITVFNHKQVLLRKTFLLLKLTIDINHGYFYFQSLKDFL